MEKKTKINLLAIQMSSVIGDKFANINKVEALIRECLCPKSADILVLPEVWTVGWDCPSFPSASESIDNSDALNMLTKIAREFSVNIIGGSIILQNENGTLANACPVLNRDGELVCVYEKNHLYSYYGCAEGDFVKAGENPVIVELDGVKVGLSICYDIRFPELYRAYRKAGADVLVNVAAWGATKKNAWDSMTTSRAVENQTYFVALTQTGKLKDGTENLGHSMILDYEGKVLDEINLSEGGILAEIDLEKMYEFRDKCKVIDDIKNSYEVIIK